jgi:hypothetical protein
VLERKILRKPYFSIAPPLDFDWQAEIDQPCLQEREREHVARMRVERIIELIAAALPELEMRAVAPPAEVWAPTGRVIFRVQTLEKLAPRWRLGRYDFRLAIEKQLRFVQTIWPVPVERMCRAWRAANRGASFRRINARASLTNAIVSKPPVPIKKPRRENIKPSKRS